MTKAPDLKTRVTSLSDLAALYGTPSQRSLDKEIDYVSDHYRAFIEKSPFVLLATVGEGGMDCSPRGDAPGFVEVYDPKTLLLPDRKGNNRVDTLSNIVERRSIALLFLIPGVGETLRVNGQADVLTDPQLLERFAMDGKIPRSVVCVQVDRVYFQCQKALARSGLWLQESQIDRSELPSAGEILQALSSESFDGESYDRDYPEYMKKSLY
ncbi:MAG: pyridoxamine 5'-phosphate oxidase family protein [Pseudomonadales bacterium]